MTIPLNIAMGPQNVRKSRAMFTKKNIALEQNEISSPNLIHMSMTKIFGKKKNKCADLPVGGAKNTKKLFQGNRWSDQLEIWYTVSLSEGEQKALRIFAYLKKHGRHWPNNFKHLLDKVTEVNQTKLYGHIPLIVLKVCKNFERNRPLVGANLIFGSVITWCFTYPPQYAYHLIALIILSNFASRTISVNQIVN